MICYQVSKGRGQILFHNLEANICAVTTRVFNLFLQNTCGNWIKFKTFWNSTHSSHQPPSSHCFILLTPSFLYPITSAYTPLPAFQYPTCPVTSSNPPSLPVTCSHLPSTLPRPSRTTSFLQTPLSAVSSWYSCPSIAPHRPAASSYPCFLIQLSLFLPSTNLPLPVSLFHLIFTPPTSCHCHFSISSSIC